MIFKIEYSTEAQAAYIRLGARRHVARTLTAVGRDEEVLVDLDENDLVIGIELIGVSYPVVELLEDRESRRYRSQEDVQAREGLL